VIAVANQKGGTGKSTIASNLAAVVGERGMRALLIDIDPQADATTMFGIDPSARPHTLYDVMVGSCELPAAITPDVATGVDLAVGSERMGDVELTLAGEMMRERYLTDALAGHIDAYDLVLIDCPPNLGLLTINAFCAAPEVLVVVSMTDRNAYKGAIALLATVQKLQRKGVDIAITAIVRNNVDCHRRTYRLLDQALVESGLPLLTTQVPMRAGFQDAVTAGVPLVHFNPDHIGAQAIRDIADELASTSTRTKAA
jgi:chromosome partitioning protein